MGLLLFRARDKIKTGDGCWAESRSSIPGNRRGLLGCGVDFFIALLERQGSFSARTIAPAPLFRRATGLKLRTRQRNTEREIRGGEIKQRSGGGEKTRSLAANRSRIRNRIAQSTEPKITRAHSRKKPLTGFLLSRVPRNAGLSKLLSRFKMGRR